MTIDAPREVWGDIPISRRPPREDALPEHLHYRDEGCDLFASCLSCPLPRCRYDVPGGARTMLNRVRDREIRRLHEDLGVAVEEIAERFRVSRRTVFRVLQRSRERRERGRQRPSGSHARSTPAASGPASTPTPPPPASPSSERTCS